MSRDGDAWKFFKPSPTESVGVYTADPDHGNGFVSERDENLNLVLKTVILISYGTTKKSKLLFDNFNPFYNGSETNWNKWSNKPPELTLGVGGTTFEKFSNVFKKQAEEYFKDKDLFQGENLQKIESSINYVHEMLEQLTLKRPSTEGLEAEKLEELSRLPEDSIKLNERIQKIKEHCNVRVKEGYMINRSLSELNKGSSLISKESVTNNEDNENMPNMPIYFEKYIYPECRSEILNNYTLDKYYSTIKQEDQSDLEKYGVLLTIAKNHFGVKNFLSNFKIYTLLVYNTSFYSLPGQVYDEEENIDQSYRPYLTNKNIGLKNNPPGPPYVNLDIIKYFSRISNRNFNKTKDVANKFFNLLKKYPFYKNLFNQNSSDLIKNIKNLDSGNIGTLKELIDTNEKLISLVEENNASTLIGTFENTEALQIISNTNIGCSNILNGEDEDENKKYINKAFIKDKELIKKNALEQIENSYSHIKDSILSKNSNKTETNEQNINYAINEIFNLDKESEQLDESENYFKNYIKQILNFKQPEESRETIRDDLGGNKPLVKSYAKTKKKRSKRKIRH